MAEYIASSTPVAVTQHGQTVGYFIPTQGNADADIAALNKASKTLDLFRARAQRESQALHLDGKCPRHCGESYAGQSNTDKSSNSVRQYDVKPVLNAARLTFDRNQLLSNN